jgi:DNA-binding NarL/FixJ family response regulator
VKETEGERRRRLRRGWAEEDLLREEDERFANTVYKLQLIESNEDLSAQLARLSETQRGFREANLVTRQRVDRQAAIAKRLRAEGKSNSEIARLAKKSRRTVERWLKRDTS